VNGKTNVEHLRRMLAEADRVYLNSDAHTLYELDTARGAGLLRLGELGLARL